MPTPTLRRRALQVALSLTLLGADCECPDSNSPSGNPITLSYVSGNGQAVKGTTITLEVKVLAAGNQVAQNAEVIWTVSGAGTLSVRDRGPDTNQLTDLSDANGISQAYWTVPTSLGTYTATATLLTKPTEKIAFPVQLIGGPVDEIAITPGIVSMSVGATRQLSAVLLDQDGDPATTTGLPGSLVWSASAGAPFTFNPSTGLLTSVMSNAVGSVAITATYTGSTGNRSASRTINVVDCFNRQIIAPNDFDFSSDVGAAGWTVFVDKTNQQFTEASSYEPTGGNTGGFRRMQHNENGMGTMTVFHRREVTYDPNAAGNEIDHINYSEDFIEFEPPFAGAAVAHGFYFEQNNTRFLKPLGTGAFTNLTWLSGAMTVTAADFSGEMFGSGGGLIRFGYYRANTNDGTGLVTTKHGIDNWRVEICKK